ncbi:MAG: UDP-N-acetylmuramoyl-tripeptide--D-alanyl-D-alanine ligase [Gammaproteobacteria bacterium]|nr:UDP-N-acetylmuramoyl-tripeptide--D-alanyl-D-alanine ligase [Gammaproteobacteria bacterium]NNM14919.1 UDP-N-acetylmuramoyl-tripeptide--D-alanyl-D-alanine ligase [Gammaproteobacteria bacterium]
MMADLNTLAHLVGGTLHGSNAMFENVSTDSRTVGFNDLFVALKGPNFNGNDFMIQAQEAGAAGALVSELNPDALINQVLVEDTLKALQVFATHWREQFSIPVIGITGSNGKTTTKTMLAEILKQSHQVHVTEGNFNNDIGVPITLLKLRENHQFSVIEMGANHRAEIGELAAMAKPDIGIITNTSAAHLEGFKDLEGVVRTKGELFQALAATGTAIINAESKGSLFLSKLAQHSEQINFGFEPGTDVRVSDFHHRVIEGSLKQVFNLRTPAWETEIVMNLLGKHNAMNAAAAAAAATVLGIERVDVENGLLRMHAVKGRFNLHELGTGGWLIDDCYNANPASMFAAIETACALEHPVWFVMGDMFEMGDKADAFHAEIGAYAKKHGVERLYTVGEHSMAAVAAFGEAGKNFTSTEELSMHLNQVMAATAEPITVLVKASRGMHFENIVSEVSKHFIEATGQYRILNKQLLESQ